MSSAVHRRRPDSGSRDAVRAGLPPDSRALSEHRPGVLPGLPPEPRHRLLHEPGAGGRYQSVTLK